MNYKTFVQELKKGFDHRLVLIHGQETHLVSKLVGQLKEAFLAANHDELNIDRLTGLEPESLRQAMDTPPFLGGEKLVLLHTDRVPPARELNEILPLLEDIPEGVRVVLAFMDKVDRRMKFVKHVAEHGTEVEVKKPYRSQVTGHLIEEAAGQGIELDRKAAELLVEYCGYDLGFLAGELKKLKNYAGSDGRVDVECVRSAASGLKTLPDNFIFKIVDAFGERDLGLVLGQIAEVVAIANEHPLRILTMISRQLRLIFWSRALSAGGTSFKDIASRLQCPPFVIKNCLQQGKNFTFDELKAALRLAAAVENDIKRGALDGRTALEMLSVKVCGARRLAGGAGRGRGMRAERPG